ncbi:MAG: hypothetical protein C0490_17910 [Marivirga sp.]|nr:hypothetical protein [Marivirga sp.]
METGNNLQTSSLTYKLIRKIKDDLFDEEFIDQYHLLINIGTRDFQLLVIEPQENKVLLLEDFVLPGLTSNEELLQILDQLFDSHAFLKAGFWKKIKVSVKNQKFVQVPQSLYAEESNTEYLKFNAPIDPSKEESVSTFNPRAQAVTVFAVNNDLKTWLNSIYPNNPPSFTHQSAALIEGTLHFAEGRDDNPLYIYVDRFKLHILACEEGKLLYYNQFAIKQFSEYIKYIMLVMKSLEMDQRTSRVVLWGYVGANSPHYHEFYKYISNVSFGDEPDYLNFGYVFDEVPEHHYFDLYSIHLID